jgi:apolipoprotein N-acyltransferase
VLAIITNDAWWGNSEGHRQHFSYSKLRAIETRKNVIRSANTGISGIIDSKGDEIIRSEYDEEIVLSGKYKENDIITFYIKYGDLIFRLSLFFVFLIFSYYLSLKISPKK